MNNWDALRVKVISCEWTTAGWKSDRNSLLDLIDAAEKHDIPNSAAANITLSNATTIIKKARNLMLDENWKEFENLFRMASTMTTNELRVAIGKPVDRINVGKLNNTFVISVSGSELERLKKATKYKFEFRFQGA